MSNQQGGTGAQSGTPETTGGSPVTGSGEKVAAECADLPLNFHVNTTLARGCYRARATPSFADGVILTLGPGVRIVFEKDAGLVLRKNQSLFAEGHEDDPVILTGAEPTRGYWQGVVLADTAATHRFRHVVIEYGGGPAHGTEQEYQPANLVTANPDGVRDTLFISHSVFRESAGHGVTLGDWTDLRAFEHNIVTENAAPVLVARYRGDFDQTSSFSGNDDDRITLLGPAVNGVLSALDVPYYAPDGLSPKGVRSERAEARGIYGILIEPGTRIIFGRDAVC